MSSQEQNVAVARAGLEAFQRGDIEAVLTVLDPGVEIYSTPELANPGTFRGHDGFLRWVRDWLEVWDDFEIEVEELEPVGQRHVVATIHQTARGKGSGVKVEMTVAYMWDAREGRATRFHLYSTREQALAAAREGEAA